MAATNGVVGMLKGSGLTSGARHSIVDYYGVGKVYLCLFGGLLGMASPGVVLRMFLKNGLPFFSLPLALWVFLFLADFWFVAKEQCVVDLLGWRYGCSRESQVVEYGWQSALSHTGWLLIYTLFEGVGSVAPMTSVLLGGCSIGAGVVSFALGVVPLQVVAILAQLTLWSTFGFHGSPVAWIQFFTQLYAGSMFCCLSTLVVSAPYVFHRFCDGGTVDLTSGRDGIGMDLDCGKGVVPHPYLSLCIPELSMFSSRSYFVDRVLGDGMSADQRSVALVGDRFLRWLSTCKLYKSREEVSLSAVEEVLMTDSAFRKWLVAKGVETVGGKKTVASFVEVLWGEVSIAFSEGKLSFSEVYDAFLVFRGEVSKVVASVDGEEEC